MEGFLAFLPLWALFLLTAGLALLAVRLGYIVGKNRNQSSGAKDSGVVASIVAATLGLLAFLLALSYGAAQSNFETRRQLVVDEASAIGASYSIAGLLPEPESTEIRAILREYLSIRADGWQVENLVSVLSRSEELQNRVWSAVTAIEKKNPDSVINVLFAQSFTQVADTHTKRAAEAFHRVLPTVWIVLYFLAFVAMAAVGYQLGLSGKHDRLVVLFLVLAFSATLWLIADFDRPLDGTLKVSQQPMIELQQKLAPQGK